MPLSSLVLSQPTSELLAKKVKVETCLLWVKDYGLGLGWCVQENSEMFWNHDDDIPVYEHHPAYTLSELPQVFKALGEVRGWGTVNECPACNLLVGAADPVQEFSEEQYHWQKFCELLTKNKKQAEEYLIKLLE